MTPERKNSKDTTEELLKIADEGLFSLQPLEAFPGVTTMVEFGEVRIPQGKPSDVQSISEWPVKAFFEKCIDMCATPAQVAAAYYGFACTEHAKVMPIREKWQNALLEVAPKNDATDANYLNLLNEIDRASVLAARREVVEAGKHFAENVVKKIVQDKLTPEAAMNAVEAAAGATAERKTLKDTAEELHNILKEIDKAITSRPNLAKLSTNSTFPKLIGLKTAAGGAVDTVTVPRAQWQQLTEERDTMKRKLEHLHLAGLVDEFDEADLVKSAKKVCVKQEKDV